MTTISQILEGLSDTFTSTGTLNRILHQQDQPDYQDLSDEDDYMDEISQEANGQLEQNQIDNQEGNQNTSILGQKSQKKSSGPKLEKILEDDEFLPELRQRNEELLKYLTLDKVVQMVDFIIIEPGFSDSPARCFKLPFVVTEAFICDNDHIKRLIFNTENTEILDKLFSFIRTPSNNGRRLNPTLGGYLNKIVSFWLIRDSELILRYIIKNISIIESLFSHLYLTQCVTDILVRLCTVKNIQSINPDEYRQIRSEIIQHCVNSLEQYHKDDFITELLFEILTGIVRKCYQMYKPREFFDSLMSPFVLQPILDFSFSGGYGSKQGSEFLKLLFFNMFIASPNEAVQDVMEINFGFQITQIAGLTTEEFSKKQDSGEVANQVEEQIEQQQNKDEKQIEKKEQATGEFETMKQEELMKQALLQGAQKIYDKSTDLNLLLVQQIMSFFTRFENLLKQQGLKTLTRIKLYELLEVLIQLDSEVMNRGFFEKRFTDIIMQSCFDLKVKLFKETQMLFRFAKRLSLTEFTLKDIYSFIGQLVLYLQKQAPLKKLLSECEPNWTALRKAVEDEQEQLIQNWGEKHLENKQPRPVRKEDIIRKHEEAQQTGINLLDKGALSTTKKIVSTSVQSRKKMMMMDDALNK
ncbi:UNKNOWN [Stylonychia lemnae]|uniref:Uncharacterized protein n=1 Tax=Stylonychia lemnae TaxID=5949 RepID=A0A078AFR7_STYLE|nr:UNKNOWN [Stylonychia lemnae]|eukprot:CDW80337.1 UNKNOWN [Stylonychia lemnae]